MFNFLVEIEQKYPIWRFLVSQCEKQTTHNIYSGVTGDRIWDEIFIVLTAIMHKMLYRVLSILVFLSWYLWFIIRPLWDRNHIFLVWCFILFRVKAGLVLVVRMSTLAHWLFSIARWDPKETAAGKEQVTGDYDYPKCQVLSLYKQPCANQPGHHWCEYICNISVKIWKHIIVCKLRNLESKH